MPHTLQDIYEVLKHSSEATAIYNSAELRIAYANLKMLKIWARQDDIIGLNLGDVFPEFVRQGFEDILKNVWRTGQTYLAENMPADLMINGELVRFHFDFEYKAMQRDGSTYAILHTTKEVSERIAAWKALAEKEEIQKRMNEELAAYNEEVLSYSEEYQALNEKLNETNEELVSSLDKLTKTEAKARAILAGAPVAIGVVQIEGSLLESANDQLLELMGGDRSLIGKPLVDFLSPTLLRYFLQTIEKVISSEATQNEDGKQIFIERDGVLDPTFQNLSFQPVRDAQAEVISVLIVAHDVTVQRNEKNNVDLALEQVRLAKKAARLGIFDFDLVSSVLNCDDRCREILHVDLGHQVDYQNDFLAKIADADRDRVEREVRRAIKTSNPESHLDTRFRVPFEDEGTEGWAQLFGQVYYSKEGVPARFIGTIADVTEESVLKQHLLDRENSLQELNEELGATMEELAASNEELLAINEDLHREQSLRESAHAELKLFHDRLRISEERLEVAVRSAQMGIWDVDFVNESVNWDARTRELFGHDQQNDVDYRDRWRAVHPEDLEALSQGVRFSKVKSSGGHFLAKFRTAPNEDGHFRWVQLQGQVYFNDEAQPVRFAGTIVDITESIVTQQQIDTINRSIAQKEIEQRMIVEAGMIGTYSFDISSGVVTTNRHFRELFRIDRRRDLWTDKIFRIAFNDKEQEDAATLFEHMILHNSFDVMFEIPTERSDNKTWLRSIGQRVREPEQDREMIYGIVIDITLQKLEEKRKMDFLGIVSHELKSPLTSLSGYLQILELKSKQAENQLFSSLLASSSRQSTRMRHLIEGFLDVARIGEGKLQLKLIAFQSEPLLDQIRQTYIETINTHAISFHQGGNFSLVADQNKIEQVIINLVNNAIKYAPSGTEICVESATDHDNFYVRVKDQGPGISQENQSKIFGRFVRIENQFNENISGFGIGLYISSEIIRLHGGEIGLESELDMGSTFWFKIPLRHSNR